MKDGIRPLGTCRQAVRPPSFVGGVWGFNEDGMAVGFDEIIVSIP
jgi:hypothetical protein